MPPESVNFRVSGANVDLKRSYVVKASFSKEDVKSYWQIAVDSINGAAYIHLFISSDYAPVNMPNHSLVPNRKIAGARSGYANFNQEKEKEILLIDSTFWGSASSGLLLTNAHIFGRHKENRNVIKLKDVKSVENKEGFIVINGIKFASVISELTLYVLADFISHYVGNNTGDYKSGLLRIAAGVRGKKVDIDKVVENKDVTGIYHRKSANLNKSKPHLKVDESIIFTGDQVIIYRKDEEHSYDDGKFTALDRKKFNKIRFERCLDHHHHHSHTPHALAHLSKHASLLNAAVAAASTVVDLSNYFAPPEGKPVFNIYVEQEKLAGYDSFERAFQHVSPEEASVIAKAFEDQFYEISYSDVSPYSEMTTTELRN
jgi:hypothetical protein